MLQDILLVLVGIVVGSMNAIAGGGTLIGFPMLLAVGLPALAANITSNIVVLPGSLSSAFGYRSYIRKVPIRYALLMIPCIIGATIGALLLRNTPSARFGQLIPFLVLFSVILFAFQPLIHFHLHRHIHGKSKGYLPLLFIGIALLPVAVYGGYFGAGFGFIMLAFLGFTSLHDIHQMNGLKNIAGACMSLTSIIVLFSTHLINWRYGLLMGFGAMIGGFFGSKFSQRISTHAVRIIVIVIGVVTATYLSLRSY